MPGKVARTSKKTSEEKSVQIWVECRLFDTFCMVVQSFFSLLKMNRSCSPETQSNNNKSETWKFPFSILLSISISCECCWGLRSPISLCDAYIWSRQSHDTYLIIFQVEIWSCDAIKSLSNSIIVKLEIFTQLLRKMRKKWKTWNFTELFGLTRKDNAIGRNFMI